MLKRKKKKTAMEKDEKLNDKTGVGEQITEEAKNSVEETVSTKEEVTRSEENSELKITEEKSEIVEKENLEGEKADVNYEEIIQELNNKVAELNDKFLRLYSEFDNYKKRVAKERIELIKTASEDVIRSMLPVYDDFDRAILSIETSTEIEAIKEGVKLIYSKFKNVLVQKGLSEMEIKKGDEFDTDKHEALTQTPVEDESMKGKIVEVVEKGFELNGKIIRYPKVVVGI